MEVMEYKTKKQEGGMRSAAGDFPAAGEAVLFLLYALISFLCAFFRILINTDEMWNFAFGENIAEGLLPYRDFNYLQTPFSALVNALLFKVFGGHILVMRLGGAVLFTAMAVILYRNARVLGAGRLLASLPGFALILIFSSNIFFEYAGFCLCVLLAVMGMDLKAASVICSPEISISGERADYSQWTSSSAKGRNISGEDESVRKARRWLSPAWQILPGILGGLAMLSKQTYGTFIAAASWVCVPLIIASGGRKAKEAVRLTFFRMLGSSIPCFVFLFYLLGSGTFSDFWEMCFLGIRTFSSRYRYLSMMRENAGLFIAGMAFPAALAAGAVFAVLLWRQAPGKREGRCQAVQMIVILIYTIFGCINMVPLANVYHFETCSIPALLIIELLLAAAFRGKAPAGSLKAKAEKGVRLLSWIAILAELIFLLVYNPIDVGLHFRLQTDIPCFEYTFISEEFSAEIRQVIDFIKAERKQGNEVYVLDNCAGYYLRPLGIYHKYLDMFLLGNLGLKTPQECLQETLLPGTVYLLPDKTRKNTQYPRSAVESFRKGLKPDGVLGSYEIYRR